MLLFQGNKIKMTTFLHSILLSSRGWSQALAVQYRVFWIIKILRFLHFGGTNRLRLGKSSMKKWKGNYFFLDFRWITVSWMIISFFTENEEFSIFIYNQKGSDTWFLSGNYLIGQLGRLNEILFIILRLPGI